MSIYLTVTLNQPANTPHPGRPTVCKLRVPSWEYALEYVIRREHMVVAAVVLDGEGWAYYSAGRYWEYHR